MLHTSHEMRIEIIDDGKCARAAAYAEQEVWLASYTRFDVGEEDFVDWPGPVFEAFDFGLEFVQAVSEMLEMVKRNVESG